MVPRSRFYKKERKKNVRNVLKEAHPSTHHPKLKFTYRFHFQEIWESNDSKKPFLQKKKEKRTLETFLKKPTPPPTIQSLNSPTSFISKGSGSPMIPRSRSYKKERKRTLEMFFFKEKLPTGNLPLIIQRLRIGCERGTGRGRRGKREDEEEGKGKTKKERGRVLK